MALAMQDLLFFVLHLGELEGCRAVAGFGGEGSVSKQADGALAGTTEGIAFRR